MAVALYFAADRSTSEIAEILGCPEGTVRSDLSRARVMLADQLGC
jgi:DNA-directed RNA polymerase specialized sigma24 family protein